MTNREEVEQIRRVMIDRINSDPLSREEFEALEIPFWDTASLSRDFEVLGFLAPLVCVKRRSDGVRGSLYFQHHPRIYFSFEEDRRHGA